MHKLQRHEEILSHLYSTGFASVEQLSKLLISSPATVRRDLIELEHANQLIRVHGGVKPADATTSLTTRLRGSTLSQNLERHTTQKQAIGKAAATLCQDGESIIINGGSTTYEMCAHLQQNGMQVLTNSFPIATRLLHQSHHRVYLTGGEIYREQEIVLSPYSDTTASHFIASKLFISAQSVTQRGLLETDSRLIRAEQELLEQAEMVVLLADSSKFNSQGNLLLCPLERVGLVVTDSGIQASSLAMLKENDIETLIVEFDEHLTPAHLSRSSQSQA